MRTHATLRVYLALTAVIILATAPFNPIVTAVASMWCGGVGVMLYWVMR